MELMRIIIRGLRITLTIGDTRHRVEGKIALLTKLTGTFDIPPSLRHRSGNIIFSFTPATDTLFFHDFDHTPAAILISSASIAFLLTSSGLRYVGTISIRALLTTRLLLDLSASLSISNFRAISASLNGLSYALLFASRTASVQTAADRPASPSAFAFHLLPLDFRPTLRCFS